MSGNSTRNNSLLPNDVEVTRQFLATNNKVINRGDSFKRRHKAVVDKVNVEICFQDSEGDYSDRDILKNKHHFVQKTPSMKTRTRV